MSIVSFGPATLNGRGFADLPPVVGLVSLILLLRPFPNLWSVQGILVGFLYALSGSSVVLLKVGQSISGVSLVDIGIVLLFAGATCHILFGFLKTPVRLTQSIVVVFLIGLGLATLFFSGPQGGAGKFIHFLRFTLYLDEPTAALVNLFVRKSIHLVTYGTLALSASCFASFQGLALKRCVVAGFVWAGPHALLDEFSQSKVATRTGSPWDVALDCLGMSIFLGIYFAMKSSRDRVLHA